MSEATPVEQVARQIAADFVAQADLVDAILTDDVEPRLSLQVDW